MKFSIITIFPRIFSAEDRPASGGNSYGYFGSSILKRAQKNNLIDIKIHNLRDYTADKHKKVDDTPYGGGAGMVMKFEPIYKAIESIKSVGSKAEKIRVILFSAKGKKYSQKDARRLAKYDNIILICGRYEGVDERVAKYVADEEISIGDYILTGGEIPAMILVDSISRLIHGVLGNPQSLEEESFSKKIGNCPPAGEARKSEIGNFDLEYPQYTKPEIFVCGGNKWKVPGVLLSGNHQRIKQWRVKNSKFKNK